MNAVPQQSPQAKGWSPERRARQSTMMRARKIWTKSTGPKTAAGKAKSAANSFKHGGRRAEIRMFYAALTRQQRYIRLIRLSLSAPKTIPANELLALKRYLGQEGPAVTKNIVLAFQIMQKSCFLERSTYKS